MCNVKVSGILVGAGLGLRMGGEVKKPFIQIHDKPIFLHTIDRFFQCSLISEIILIVGESEIDYVLDKWRDSLDAYKVKKIVPGGKRRQDSVFKGLCNVDTDSEIVLIHDAVRPLVKKEHIEGVIHKAKECNAAILAAPMKATVKEINDDLSIKRTIPRSKLWMAQTPQGFEKRLITEVFRQFQNSEKEFTDDAQMVEEAGHPVYIVPGSDDNIKITTPDDISIAEALLK
ncbi:MAG: 2-C-methyl-D-erythritol 4-phosphate cytidylyltransferase [Candidatus Kuenenia sp.]|nr:2-C-methyl-D-erythritol 4-phosphate cytidylyltransferase [Candidatus Kuenenia hertensis]